MSILCRQQTMVSAHVNEVYKRTMEHGYLHVDHEVFCILQTMDHGCLHVDHDYLHVDHVVLQRLPGDGGYGGVLSGEAEGQQHHQLLIVYNSKKHLESWRATQKRDNDTRCVYESARSKGGQKQKVKKMYYVGRRYIGKLHSIFNPHFFINQSHLVP